VPPQPGLLLGLLRYDASSLCHAAEAAATTATTVTQAAATADIALAAGTAAHPRS
jgi:hypothetical protein